MFAIPCSTLRTWDQLQSYHEDTQPMNRLVNLPAPYSNFPYSIRTASEALGRHAHVVRLVLK